MRAGLSHFETYRALDHFYNVKTAYFSHPVVQDYNFINAKCFEIEKVLKGKSEFVDTIDHVRFVLNKLRKVIRDIITNNYYRSFIAVPAEHADKSDKEKLIIIGRIMLDEILEEGLKLRNTMKKEKIVINKIVY